MPARRRKQRLIKKNKRLNIKGLAFLVLATLVVLFILFFQKSKMEKAVVVYPLRDYIEVAVFDFEKGEIISIEIPDTTEVNVARGLGTWKIGKVWQIGQNEKLDGELLRETVVKNFGFPVAFWMDGDLGSWLIDNEVRFSKGMFSAKTNLNWAQKIRLKQLGFFAKNNEKSSINLANTSYLVRNEFLDGTSGYRITGTVPEKLFVYFGNKKIAQVGTILVIDGSGTYGLVESVSKTISFLGNKVTLVQDGQTKPIECEVAGQGALEIEKLLGCKVVNSDTQGFDLVVTLGENFL